jgi:cellulose synthase (UDP-forming)
MISGLAPETFSGFITQRVRWAQGMVQIFFLKNPLFVPGLRFYQRLAYFSSSFFWFFPYARLVFLLAPVGYLVFGLHVYNASLLQILGYTLPHLVASLIVSDFLFGKVRWTFISELYEVMQSFFCFQGITEVIRSPRGISFKVTPKGKIVNRDFISPLVGPFYLLLALTGAAVIDAVLRIFVIVRPLERYAVLITLGWALFNGIILLAALGALFERQQRRASARLPANYWATIRDEQRGSLAGDIHDLSEGGASLFLPADIPVLSLGTQTMMEVHSWDGERNYEFQVLVRNHRIIGNHSVVGLEFAHRSLQETAEKMTLVFGQSQRWLAFQQQRDGGIGIFRSFFFLLRLGFQGLLHHLLYHASNVLRRFRFKAKHVPLKRSAGSVSVMQSA